MRGTHQKMTRPMIRTSTLNDRSSKRFGDVAQPIGNVDGTRNGPDVIAQVEYKNAPRFGQRCPSSQSLVTRLRFVCHFRNSFGRFSAASISAEHRAVLGIGDLSNAKQPSDRMLVPDVFERWALDELEQQTLHGPGAFIIKHDKTPRCVSAARQCFACIFCKSTHAVHNPTVLILDKIAKALKVPAGVLLEELRANPKIG